MPNDRESGRIRSNLPSYEAKFESPRAGPADRCPRPESAVLDRDGCPTLLKSVQNFLKDAAVRTNSRKRGGDVSFVSWDPWMTEEAPSELALASEALNSWPAERLFDAGWAATLVQRAIPQLREDVSLRGGYVFSKC
jgi:hypothetical protein